MPDGRQKYGVRIALSPGNAIEGVTYMDLKSIREEIRKAQEEGDYAALDCVDQDDNTVHVVFRAADVQVIMHQDWVRPQSGRIAIPEPMIPKPKIVQ